MSTSESSQVRDQLAYKQSHNYQMATMEVNLSKSVCDLGVDHLIFGVESLIAEECLVYNNYHAHPITCGSGDIVDIGVKPDRKERPIFELIRDNTIVLGQPKQFALNVQITVQGNTQRVCLVDLERCGSVDVQGDGGKVTSYNKTTITNLITIKNS